MISCADTRDRTYAEEYKDDCYETSESADRRFHGFRSFLVGDHPLYVLLRISRNFLNTVVFFYFSKVLRRYMSMIEALSIFFHLGLGAQHLP